MTEIERVFVTLDPPAGGAARLADKLARRGTRSRSLRPLFAATAGAMAIALAVLLAWPSPQRDGVDPAAAIAAAAQANQAINVEDGAAYPMASANPAVTVYVIVRM